MNRKGFFRPAKPRSTRELVKVLDTYVSYGITMEGVWATHEYWRGFEDWETAIHEWSHGTWCLEPCGRDFLVLVKKE